MKETYANGALELLYEKEKELEQALETVREKIREVINYADKNKEKHNGEIKHKTQSL